MAQNHRPRPGPTGGSGPPHHDRSRRPDECLHRVRPARAPRRQGRPGAHRRRRAPLRGHREQPRARDRRPVRPARRRPAVTGRHGSGRARPRPRGAPPHRSAAHPAALRAGPLPRPRRARRRRRAGLRRAAGPHRRRRRAAARRLALTGGRAVLRCDPRRPDGPGQPPPLPVDPRPGQRLLGRGVHHGRLRGACRRPGRPVRLHRQPRCHPLGPDARRAGHHRGRPGRHRPRRVEGCARRRRRPGHRQDRRRAAPHRLPAVLRPAPGPPQGRRAVRRPAPALPRLRRRRAAQPRRGGGADLHAARPRAGRGGGRRGGRPAGGPAQGRRTAGGRGRAGGAPVRGATHRGHGGHDALGRRLARHRRLGRRVRHPAARGGAQREPRRGLGGAPRHPRRQAAGGGRRGGAGHRRLRRLRPHHRGPAGEAPPCHRGQPRARGGVRPGVAAGRADRPRG